MSEHLSGAEPLLRQRLRRRRLLRLRRRRLLRSAAASGALLVSSTIACGTLGRGSARDQRSAGSSAPGKEPRTGGTLKVPVNADPFDWDTSYSGRSEPNSYGIVMAQEPLLGFKGGPGVAYSDLVIQPRLAETWEVSPDATSFIFHLRKGVKFASLPPTAGRELTAADVKFSYEYASRSGEIRDKNLPVGYFQFMFEGLQQIETPDPSTVVVHFKAPFVPFLNYAASNQNPIVPREIYDQDHNFKNRLVGTGPYQLDNSLSQKGTRSVWRRNPLYWQSGRPYIDEVDWIVIPDGATAQSAFQSNQIDWIDAQDANSAASLRRSNPEAVANEYLNPAPVHVYMEVERPPFNDIRIRKALALSIDRDEFVRALSQGKGGWALAAAFPDTFSQDEIKQLLKRDVDQARSLLRDAGYPDGLQIELPINPAYGQFHVKQGELLQSQAKAAGINLVLQPIDNADYAQRKRARQYTLMYTNKSLQAEIDSYIYSAFYPGLQTNFTGVNDPKLTQMLVAQRGETDAAKRREIIREAVRYINTEAYWAAALYYDVNTEFWHPALQSYAPSFGNQTGGGDPPSWSVDCWLDR